MKTSTRDKKGLGRKRVSKQNKRITGLKKIQSFNKGIIWSAGKFLKSYHAVSSVMFLTALFTSLSIIDKGGPIGKYTLDFIFLLFGYGTYAIPVIFMYGSFILFRDKDDIQSQNVFVGSIYVLVTSTALFHSLIHTNPQPYTAGSHILKNSGGYVSSFIAYPLSKSIGIEMTQFFILFLLVSSVIYMTDIKLQDLITGIQSIFSYSARFIYAFYKARREIARFQIENIQDINNTLDKDNPDIDIEEGSEIDPKKSSN